MKSNRLLVRSKSVRTRLLSLLFFAFGGVLFSSAVHAVKADPFVPFCAENKTPTAQAQCRIDSPSSFGLGWLSSSDLLKVAQATVHIQVPKPNGHFELCSGTLVRTKPSTRFAYILTAAHCFPDPSLTDTGTNSNVSVAMYTNYRTNSCNSNQLAAVFSNGGGTFRSARLVHLNRALDTALLLFDASVDSRLRSDAQVVYATVDPGDFQSDQAYANAHHPNAADLRLQAGTVGSGDASVDFSWTDESTGTPRQVSDGVKLTWVDSANEPGSSGSGLFTIQGGQLLVKGTATTASFLDRSTPSSEDFSCSIGADFGYFAKVKNSYASYRAHIEPTSEIAVSIFSQAILGDASVVQLHTESGAFVDATILGILPTTKFTNVPTGSYYVDVYGWDMRIATSQSITLHDRNACTSEFDCRQIRSTVTLRENQKQSLTITVKTQSNTLVPNATVALDSWNGAAQVWTPRASAGTNANGVALFSQVWPAELQGEQYRVRVSSVSGDLVQTGIKVLSSSPTNAVVVTLPAAGSVASQTPSIASVTSTAANGCDPTNANRGYVTLAGANYTSSSAVTLSDGTTAYTIPAARTTLLSATSLRVCANVYYTPNWSAQVTNGGTPSNSYAFTVSTTTGSSCSPSFALSSATFAAAANVGSVDVLAGPTCPWSATSSNTSWLTISQGTSGMGNGRVYYSLSANGSAPRTANVSLSSGAVHAISQSSSTAVSGPGNCTYAVSPSSTAQISSDGQNVSFYVSTQTGCTWTTTADAYWATTSTPYLSGSSGTVVAIAPNNATTPRSASVSIAGVPVTLVQAGRSLPTSGSIQLVIDPPEAVAAGGQWGTADSTNFQNSGTTISGLSLGASHCITVKPISGWSTLSAPCFNLFADSATITTTLTLYRQVPVTLSAVSALAPIAVFAGQSVLIQSDALWTNNTRTRVAASWSVSNSSALQHRGGGLFVANSALVADTEVTVTASYTSGSTTVSDSKKIAILRRFAATGPSIALGSSRRVAAAYQHSVAVRDDGTVWAWGANNVGQLGNGSYVDSAIPVQVIGLSDVVEVSSDFQSSFALKADGTVWAWGWNGNGDLGDGTTTNRNIPVRVANLSGVLSVCTSPNVTYAVRADGSVWGWGSTNAYFQQLLLGPSPQNYWSPPVQLTALGGDNVYACPSNYAGLAVKRDGSALRWGVWRYGSPDQVLISAPEPLSGFDGANGLSFWGGDVALSTANGKFAGLGTNSNYVLASYFSDVTAHFLSSFETNFGFDDVSAVAIGNGVGTVLLRDGKVVGIGSQWYSSIFEQFVPDQVGRFAPNQVAYFVPTIYSGLTNIIGLPSRQSNHGLAVRNDGCVMSWGQNSSGQTGQGAATSAYSPVASVSAPDGVSCFNLGATSRVVALPSSSASGTVLGTGTYPKQQSIRVSATALPGYAFAQWTESSVPVSSAADYDFVVTSDRNLVANFNCDYRLSSYLSAFPRVGGSAAPVSVATGSGCIWAPTSTATWVQVSGSSTAGSGAFAFSVAPNTTGFARAGTIEVGSQNLLISQSAGCWLDIDGDSLVTPEKDAVLLLRYLLGFRGDGLIAGISLGARDTASKIEDFIGSGSQFDVFGRIPPAPFAMIDGLILSRLMAGIPDAALLSGVSVPSGSSFVTANDVRNNVNQQCGTAY